MEGAFCLQFPLGFEEPEGFAIRFEAQGEAVLTFGRGLYLLDGPNGAGKSSFLNLLALLVGRIGPDRGKDRGRIVYDGVDYTAPAFDSLRAADLREARFAIFPQKAFFLPVSTRDNYRILNGRDPGRALTFSDRERPQQLSGGQQQQVLMRIVLDPEKPVWFLDEPLANLDRRRRLAFWRHLDAGWCRGVGTFFFIDHLLAALVRKDKGFASYGRLRVTTTHRAAGGAADEVKAIRLYHAPDPSAFFRRQIAMLTQRTASAGTAARESGS